MMGQKMAFGFKLKRRALLDRSASSATFDPTPYPDQDEPVTHGSARSPSLPSYGMESVSPGPNSAASGSSSRTFTSAATVTASSRSLPKAVSRSLSGELNERSYSDIIDESSLDSSLSAQSRVPPRLRLPIFPKTLGAMKSMGHISTNNSRSQWDDPRPLTILEEYVPMTNTDVDPQSAPHVSFSISCIRQ